MIAWLAQATAMHVHEQCWALLVIILAACQDPAAGLHLLGRYNSPYINIWTARTKLVSESFDCSHNLTPCQSFVRCYSTEFGDKMLSHCQRVAAIYGIDVYQDGIYDVHPVHSSVEGRYRLDKEPAPLIWTPPSSPTLLWNIVLNKNGIPLIPFLFIS